MKLPNIFAKNAVAVRYAAGVIIFEIGQPRDLMFIVQEGEVDIKIGGKIVETVSAEGFFGEMALIDGGVRSATAIAKTDCALIPINEKQFLFMARNPIFFPYRYANAKCPITRSWSSIVIIEDGWSLRSPLVEPSKE